ncbi:hypothetical protein E5288_WYG009931 [Bos mutus]|uniref:Uncharacterized protein n=1 Tax=Bos mutus TaxID=72004 RepID=A0A6B0S7N2_9CETA|nr:hypothetical protein [Bos mutus]
MSNFNRFSEMMNNMGGDENVDLPEVDGAGDDSQDSDEKKVPDLESSHLNTTNDFYPGIQKCLQDRDWIS